jgi:signal-transduction protein with cAMP-binding, CBS, and nucleotidyltransferase domain
MKAGTTQLPDIRSRASVETAAVFMMFWGTDRVEVFDEDGRSLGIITERDLVRSIAKGRRPEETCMTELLDEQPPVP